MKSLAVLSAVERLSPLVLRVLGQNPGPVTLQGTNTYLVGRGPDVALVDTGEPGNIQYKDLLSSVLQDYHLTIRLVILTHFHPDHSGGYLGVCRGLGITAPCYKIPHPHDSAIFGEETMKGFINPEHGLEVQMSGAHLTIYHTPGHTCDSLSVFMKEEEALFCGDTILGASSASFDDYSSYMKTLKFYEALNPRVIYTGHGVCESPETISKYIQHRQSRENMILAGIREFGRPVSLEEIVAKVYKEDNILHIPALVVKATEVTKSIAEKLLIDGTVEMVGDLWKAK